MSLGVTGALLAASAVGLGAFGAHGLAERLAGIPAAAEWWRTATFYLLVHAAAVAVLPATEPRGPRFCLVVGAAVFAGTLYAMALGGPRWLGAVTPVGGLLLMGGWAWLAIGRLRANLS